LRRDRTNPGGVGFVIEQLDHDFVGATAEQLYKQIFEIEELDDTFLEYAAKATRVTSNDKRISELNDRKDKGTLLEGEDRELRQLEEERRRIRRAIEVKGARNWAGERDLEIEKLKSKILRLESKVTG
jgi:hypothetical protein